MEETELLDINRNFAEARKFVEDKLGIELKLGELSELKQQIGFIVKLWNNKTNDIRPWAEASLIFMNRNYETQIYSLRDNAKFNIKRYEWKKLMGFDYYPEYFKRVQEEMHLP